VVSVMDSIGNTATATATVTAMVSATVVPPSGGCSSTGAEALPLGVLIVLPLLRLRRRSFVTRSFRLCSAPRLNAQQVLGACPEAPGSQRLAASVNNSKSPRDCFGVFVRIENEFLSAGSSLKKNLVPLYPPLLRPWVKA
jgi:hypothetical protein